MYKRQDLDYDELSPPDQDSLSEHMNATDTFEAPPLINTDLSNYPVPDNKVFRAQYYRNDDYEASMYTNDPVCQYCIAGPNVPVLVLGNPFLVEVFEQVKVLGHESNLIFYTDGRRMVTSDYPEGEPDLMIGPKTLDRCQSDRISELSLIHI